MLTADLVREIAAGAALKPQKHRLFKLEDIAMGSWIRHVAKERCVKVRLHLAIYLFLKSLCQGWHSHRWWHYFLLIPVHILSSSLMQITPCA